MPKTTQTQTPSSVLSSLMDEYQLNPFSLSKEISLSHSAVRLIANGKGKISVATALRLAKYFGQTPEYWLDLQCASDLDKAQNNKKLMAVIKGITKAKKPTANSKSKGKPAKKTTLSDTRKKAAKVPGAKPASRKSSSTSKKKK
jgi:addiction module HigA family antidote